MNSFSDLSACSGIHCDPRGIEWKVHPGLSPITPAVPEPSTTWMLVVGLAVGVYLLWRRKR